MGSFLEFSLFCLRAPINESACGPLWLVVSFVAFGAAAISAVLLLQSYRDWCRWRAWRIKHSRASKDDSTLLNDPDFANAVQDIVHRRADRRKSPRMTADRRSAPRVFHPDLHPE